MSARFAPSRVSPICVGICYYRENIYTYLFTYRPRRDCTDTPSTTAPIEPSAHTRARSIDDDDDH